MRPTLAPILALVLAMGVLASCADFPELDARTTRVAADAPYPRLVPLDGLLAAAAAPGQAEAAGAALAARAASLRARADALRGRTIIDGAERLRLLRAAGRG